MSLVNSRLLAAFLLLVSAVPAVAQVNLTFPTTSTTVIGRSDIPNCQDTGGNHLNFNSSAGAFSCGTSSSGGGGGGPLSWSSGSATATTANVHVGVGISAGAHASAAPIIVPVNGTVTDLACNINVLDAGNTYTFTLSVNGTNNTNQQVTGLNTLTFTSGTNVGVAVTRGQTLTIHFATSGGAPTPRVQCSARLT